MKNMEIKTHAIRDAKGDRKSNFKRLVAVRMRKQPDAVKLVVYGTQFLYYTVVSGVMSLPNLFHVSHNHNDRMR